MSLLCRFGGQCRRFYSIAEHSVFVHDLVEARITDAFPNLLLAALLHDAHEAYLGDIVTPLKRKLRGYNGFVCGFDRAIGAALGVLREDFRDDIVKDADHQAIYVEGASLLGAEFWKEGADPLPEGVEWRGGLDQTEAKELFESRAANLLRRRRIEDQQSTTSVGSQGDRE